MDNIDKSSAKLLFEENGYKIDDDDDDDCQFYSTVSLISTHPVVYY